jgi:hypothetical protein
MLVIYYARVCSLEMLESVCLICAMLLEVPSMAANPLNPKKRIISKSFHRILDTQNRQVCACVSVLIVSQARPCVARACGLLACPR